MLLDSEDDEGEEAEPPAAGQVSYNKQTMPGKYLITLRVIMH